METLKNIWNIYIKPHITVFALTAAGSYFLTGPVLASIGGSLPAYSVLFWTSAMSGVWAIVGGIVSMKWHLY